MFLDDDDYFCDGAIKVVQEKIALRHDFIFFNFKILTGANIQNHELNHVTRTHLLVSNHIPIGAYLISKQAIKVLFDTKLKSHEDWSFLLDNVIDLPLIHFPDSIVVINKNENLMDSRHLSSQRKWWLVF
jgi:hypothetical protein